MMYFLYAKRALCKVVLLCVMWPSGQPDKEKQLMYWWLVELVSDGVPSGEGERKRGNQGQSEGIDYEGSSVELSVAPSCCCHETGNGGWR